MREDLNYLAAAYEGRMEMLDAIFGGGRRRSRSSSTPASPAAPEGHRPLTPAAFDQMLSDNDNIV